MLSSGSPDFIPALVERGSKLRLDAAVADVFDRFHALGVRALLLKGASLESWLYRDDGPRLYGDGDLLVAPDDIDAGNHALGELGYGCTFDERSMPSWWREHSSTWFRGSDAVTIDMHRGLPGVNVDDRVAWGVLSRDSAVVLVAGRSVPALGLQARALHVVLHAAQHGAGAVVPITDLERALAVADRELWLGAAALAQELDAIDAFSAGLGLTDSGGKLRAELGLPPTRSVAAVLHATTPPPAALGFEQLAQAEGVTARIAIVWRKLLPPPAFIRHWDPAARESRIALARAYGRRPIWILRHAAPGFRAWYRARRSVGGRERLP